MLQIMQLRKNLRHKFAFQFLSDFAIFLKKMSTYLILKKD
jgi:hypothetical protein